MPQDNTKNLIDRLMSFDLGETDAKVYIKSLAFGPATVQELAIAMKQNRVTVHSAIERLREKGFLSESRDKKRRLLVAAEPSMLKGIIERKRFDVEQISKKLENTVSLLEQLQTTSRYFPTVEFYEGKLGFQRMLEQTLDAKNEVLVLSYVPVFEKIIGGDFLRENILERAKKDIYTKLLFPPCEFGKTLHEKKWKYNVDVRFMPEHLMWNAALFLWNDTAVLASFKEGRLTTTFIENKDISGMLRMMHAVIWESAENL